MWVGPKVGIWNPKSVTPKRGQSARRPEPSRPLHPLPGAPNGEITREKCNRFLAWIIVAPETRGRNDGLACNGLQEARRFRRRRALYRCAAPP